MPLFSILLNGKFNSISGRKRLRIVIFCLDLMYECVINENELPNEELFFGFNLSDLSKLMILSFNVKYILLNEISFFHSFG